MEVIGIRSFMTPLLGILIIAAFFFFLYQNRPVQQWFTGYERFAIPLLTALSWWLTRYLYAIVKFGRGKHIELDMISFFNQELPKIPWREVFPYRPKSETIIHA